MTSLLSNFALWCVQPRTVAGFRGTVRYASVNAHKNKVGAVFKDVLFLSVSDWVKMKYVTGMECDDVKILSVSLMRDFVKIMTHHLLFSVLSQRFSL